MRRDQRSENRSMRGQCGRGLRKTSFKENRIFTKKTNIWRCVLLITIARQMIRPQSIDRNQKDIAVFINVLSSDLNINKEYAAQKKATDEE